MKKTDKENLKKAAIIGLLIFVFGYFSCWWGGPHAVYDLNQCPNSCWLVNDSGNDNNNNGGNSALSCPPIDTKLRQTDPVTMNTAATSCIAPASWTETSTLVSCRQPLNNINCRALLNDPQMLKLIYDASIFGALYHCQPDGVWIWCPGFGPLPYPPQSACGWYYTSGDQGGAHCGGPCPSGQTCTTMGETCTCVPNEPEPYPCGGFPEIGQGGILTCENGGTCPPGQFCSVHDAPLNGNAYCYCAELQ